MDSRYLLESWKYVINQLGTPGTHVLIKKTQLCSPSLIGNPNIEPNIFHMFSLYPGNFFTNLHSYANFLISSSFQGFGQIFYCCHAVVAESLSWQRDGSVRSGDEHHGVCSHLRRSGHPHGSFHARCFRLRHPLGLFRQTFFSPGCWKWWSSSTTSCIGAGIVSFLFSLLWFFQAPYGMQLPLSVKVQSSSWVLYIVGRLKRAFDSGRWLLFLCSSLKAVCAHLCAC